MNTERNTLKSCPKCGGDMQAGKALRSRATSGTPDFADAKDAVGQTFTYSGEAVMVEVLKCASCGYSRTEHTDEIRELIKFPMHFNQVDCALEDSRGVRVIDFTRTDSELSTEEIKKVGLWIAETLNASAGLQADEWHVIKSDGLPKKSGEYLVTRWLSDDIVIFTGNPKRYVAVIDEFELGKGWRFTNPMAKVIAWRNLPEPFMENKNV